MTTKQVTVTKYISCDDAEFDTRSKCEAHEREVRNILENDMYQLRLKKQQLLYAINDARINAQIAWLDAGKAMRESRSAKSKSECCKLMYDYWRFTSEYNVKRRELFEVRRQMGAATDNLYRWFGLRKKQSSIARLQRKRRSLRWRSEHTVDKWRTPHKIRVNKQNGKDGE